MARVGAKIIDSKPRENYGTEGEAKGVGRDMTCPRKLIFNPPEVSFFWRKSVFWEVCMQFCLALRCLVTFRPPLHETFAFLSNIRSRKAWMRTSQKTDFCLKKDFRSSKNNFRRHDISQGLDRESPSFSLAANWFFLCKCSAPILTNYLWLTLNKICL